MKPRLLEFIFCSFLFIMPLTGVEALTVSSEQLPIILEKTGEKVEELQSYSADEIYAVVKKNLDRMEELKKLVNPKVDIKPHERAKKITALLKQMTDDYTAIASQSGKIERGLKEKLEEIKALLADPKAKIDEIEREKRALVDELMKLPTKEPDAIRRSILEQSLKAQLSFIEGEIGVWQNFSNLQSSMANKAEEMRKMVSNFILILVENSRVYNKAHRLAMVNEQYQEAINSLDQNYDEIKEITKRLMESWYDLQQAADELMKLSTKPPG